MAFVNKSELIDGNYTTQTTKNQLEDHVENLVPTAAQEILNKISQWGLKEVWLGGQPRGHTRWDHTKGALTIGLLWYRHLIDEHLEEHWSRQLGLPRSGLKKLVLVAVALHDVGHLLFAHLLGEVLESINWVPPGRGLSGLEQEVLKARFDRDFRDFWNKLGTQLNCKPDSVNAAVTDLIAGRHGLPWAQAIVNSPIDADKLDYVQRDSEFLRNNTYLVGARLPPSHNQKPAWLAEFFAGQSVNHAGLLSLSGRSAVFAADLIRDRIYLYDRFYLCPEIRAAERMAFEIVQQFVIRAVMDTNFRRRAMETMVNENVTDQDRTEDVALGSSMDGKVDVRTAKCQSVVRIFGRLAQKAGGSYVEFEPLKAMHGLLKDEKSVDQGVKELWGRCFDRLNRLKESYERNDTTLPDLAKQVLVREPLVLRRRQYDLALEILRPLQHVYARDVLIDLVKLPRALGAGCRWRGAPGRRAHQVDWSILVPEGPISRWGPGSRACQPLTEEAVRELERPYARVVVVAPRGADVHSEYIWDRVRAALLEGGVELVKKARAA